jgi:flagellin
MSRVVTVRNEFGASYGLASFSGSALYHALNFAVASQGFHASTHRTAGNTAGHTLGSLLTAAHWGTQAMTASAVAALIAASGTFTTQANSVATALNTVGAETNFVTSQVSYNNNKIDALNSGLGSLIDADLAKESAQLQALQIRQQLGTQALSLANQAPQTLLSLFK